MVAHVDSTLPRAMCTSRARGFHVPRSFLVCVLSLWLTLSAAHALDPNKRFTQYAHTAWRIQDGFLPNSAYWISQTEDGYLWVGDLMGAWRFDGVRFTPWSAPITSTPIFRPVNVRAGEFWIATRSELDHVRDNVVISHYEIPVIRIYKDSDGSVWTLSYTDPDRVLCHATDAQIRCFGKAEGLTIRMPTTFIPDGKGGFWIGGDTSLFHWKIGAAPEIYSFQQLQSSVGTVGIHSLLENSDGSLLLGIMSAGPGLGLERFRNGVLTPVVLPNFDGSKLIVYAIMEDSDKNLWIATVGNGIYRIHGQTVDHFGRADGLSSDSVFGLYESDDGIVWAATSDGIDNFRDLPVTTFSPSEGLGRKGATSVMATKDGTVWVGGGGTLDFVRNGAVSSVRVPGDQVSSMLEDRQGNIWIGVDDGLFIYKDGRFRRIPEPGHHPLGLVVGLTEDVDGNIWAECKGVQRRLIRIRDFKVREQFPEPQVPGAHTIAADPKGGIWLGTLTGDLTFFRDGIAHTSPLKPKSKSMADRVAIQIAVDTDGSVITAPPEGLAALRAGKVLHLGKENGLPCDGVNGFVVDDNKNLWLSAPCGFIEIAASDFQRWWIHPDTIVQARVFDTLDGARPGYVSFNPAAKSPDGRLWFVNQVVLQTIDPSHLPGDGTVSPVYVEVVVADRKQYKPQEGLKLPPLTRDLQIGYTSPSFLIPQKVKFRYRLDGHDRDWQDPGTRREAFYTQLGPGKYRFHVIACNSGGVWSEADATLDFAIAPAFYQTVWFRSLGVLLFLAVLTGLYRLRLRHLERQRDALRKSEKELREVVETIPAMIHTAGPDGYIDYFNQRWLVYLGVTLEEVAGWNWTAFIHADDVEGILARWRACLMTGEIFEYETRVRGANGEYRWMFHRKVPLRDANGNIVKWYGSSMDIHERKTAEEALRSSEAYLAEAQRLSRTGSFGWKPDTGEIVWSDETYRIFEYDQVVKPTIDLMVQRVHPEDRPDLLKVIENASAGATQFEHTYRLLLPDGSVKHVHALAHALQGASGNREFVGAATDVTSIKRAEEELRKSEKELRDVIDTIPALVWSTLPDGSNIYVNKRFVEYTGSSAEQTAGSGWQALVHPDDLERHASKWMEAVATGKPHESEVRSRRSDGQYRWQLDRGMPLRDKDENIIKWYGVTTDIEDRKRAEEALQRSKAYLAEAQRLSKTGSFAWSTTKDNTYYSDECCRLLGFEPNETPPPLEAVMERIHPEDQPYCRELVERSIRDKVDVEFDYRIIDSDKSVRNIHCVSHPVLDQDGNLDEFIGTVIDVTERKRADEERQAAQQERERLNQLEADLAHINRVSMLGEMAASLAHEIKQPIAAAITSANSCIEWLAHEPPNLDRARAAAARIDKYGNRAAEIIDRMRSFYKKSPPQRELVDANQIIQEMLTLLKGEADRCSVAIRTELAEELPKITAERVQLQQVFMNLMLNAIEAMSDSGGELTVKSELQDGQLQFSVSDAGVGLPMEKMDQIFSAFFTTKPQGSGMGLAISRSIVESHGGQLWASANSGGGATFHFTLPIQLTESSPLVA
jgi:PAS domain S-box-containing protein